MLVYQAPRQTRAVPGSLTTIISGCSGDGAQASWASLSAPAACPDGSDFWESVSFTDHSQHSQMVMALTLRCPLKLDASLCQRRGWHTLCEDVPNATARESEGVRRPP